MSWVSQDRTSRDERSILELQHVAYESLSLQMSMDQAYDKAISERRNNVANLQPRILKGSGAKIANNSYTPKV